MRRCSRASCNAVNPQPLINFHQNRKACKTCILEENSRWRKENPKAYKGSKLKKYWPELTSEQAYSRYESLLAAQGGKCAMCPATKDTRGRDLCVDHCHKTGKVRGLLCDRCNRLLGWLREDLSIFEAAISYLTKD